jgi:hypothetical protein
MFSQIILAAIFPMILLASIVPEQHSGIQSYKVQKSIINKFNSNGFQVRGRLMCGDQPAGNVRVKLVKIIERKFLTLISKI